MKRIPAASVGLALALAVIAGSAGSTPAVAASPAPVTEVAVKAAFLFRFGSFVEWPARSFGGPEDPFVIGVAGAEEIASELRDIVSTRTMDGRPVRVEELAPGQSPDALQILFVGRNAAADFGRLTDALGEAPVLVVAETPNALTRGGMINFAVVDSRVRFDVAPANADKQGLHISAQLLAVARRVIQVRQ